MQKVVIRSQGQRLFIHLPGLLGRLGVHLDFASSIFASHILQIGGMVELSGERRRRYAARKWAAKPVAGPRL